MEPSHGPDPYHGPLISEARTSSLRDEGVVNAFLKSLLNLFSSVYGGIIFLEYREITRKVFALYGNSGLVKWLYVPWLLYSHPGQSLDPEAPVSCVYCDRSPPF